jgi:hypothetical protein
MKTSPDFSAVIVVEERETLPEISGGISRETPQGLGRRGGSPSAPRYQASVLEQRSSYFQGRKKIERWPLICM